MQTAYTILDPRPRERAPQGMCALAMMIKVPRAGASKTRLVPPLEAEEAAALSVCFLRDTSANIDGARRASVVAATAATARGVAVYTPAGEERAFDGLLPEGFALLAQRGDDFGARLFHAAEDLLAAGFASVCLIDSDSPTLPQRMLERAVAALRLPGDRVVLGPCDDGGYYLIGLKRAHRRLFQDVEWSTASVLAQTIERAAELNLDVEMLPAWYDVDDAATLTRLYEEMFASSTDDAVPLSPSGYDAPHTRRFLAGIVEREGSGRICGGERESRAEDACTHAATGEADAKR